MRAVPVIGAALLLAGCSERVIATANDHVLVVAENLKHSEARSTAELYYLLARPTPLSDAPEDAGALVTSMRYEAVFDCESGAWGSQVHDVILADGRTISDKTPEPNLVKPSAGSVGEDVLTSVCDSARRATRATRRARASIEKDYLAR